MKDKYLILAFDLNTKFTGVWAAEEDKDGNILSIHTATLIVDDFKVAAHTPYMESKKTLPSNITGTSSHSTYWKKGEIHVSKTEKAKRDREVRRLRNDYQILNMSHKMGDLLKAVKPDFVILERNEMFRGIMTIEVLAKLNGTLLGECALLKIPYAQVNVNAVREPYNVPKLIKEFAAAHPAEVVAAKEDVGKAAIGWYLERKYASRGVSFTTYDESDAGLAYDYYKYHKRGGGLTVPI